MNRNPAQSPSTQNMITEQHEDDSPNFRRKQELNINYMIDLLEFNSEEKQK